MRTLPATRSPLTWQARIGLLARQFVHAREASIFVLLAVVTLAVWLQAPRFLSVANIRGIFLAIALLLVLAVGETVVLLGRNFDLSIGSTVGLSAMVAGLVFKGDAGISEILVFVIAVAVGAAVGITNGLLITYLRVPSIVLTLGMLYLVSGITYIVAHGNQVNPYNVPSGFVSLSITSPIDGIPWIVIIAFVFAAIIGAALRWTRHGRSLYALGSNPEAAQLRGLPARRLVIATFVLSGAAAGMGGALYLSQYGLVQIDAGSGLELQAITAAIVGGVSVFGGSGTILGASAACILLGAITNGIAVLGYSPFLQDTVFGGLLVVAVVANSVSRRIDLSRSLVRPELKS
jgi:rhamnose transport system permease protein